MWNVSYTIVEKFIKQNVMVTAVKKPSISPKKEQAINLFSKLLSGWQCQMRLLEALRHNFSRAPSREAVEELSIGVGAGKVLGVRRIIARILPNLPEKSSKKVTFTKKKHLMWFWAPFFQIKACWAQCRRRRKPVKNRNSLPSILVFMQQQCWPQK